MSESGSSSVGSDEIDDPGRDPKGLNAAAFAGEIDDFTGVSAPYEEPLTPELRLGTTGRTPSESAATVIDRLEELNLISERVESEL